jgi:hypothetical protein
MNLMTGPATEALECSLKEAFKSGPVLQLISQPLDIEQDNSFPVISWSSDEMFDHARLSPPALTRKCSDEGCTRGIVRSKAFRDHLSHLDNKPAALERTMALHYQMFEPLSQKDGRTSHTASNKPSFRLSQRKSSLLAQRGILTMILGA